MGFLDKAKQLAEQAQHKLDEAQKNFNQSGSPQAQPDEGAVRYDEHGRPIQETPPAGAAPPAPIAEPAAAPPESAPPPDPTSPSAPPAPASGADPASTNPGAQPNAAPDPFKPLQQ
jgi:hypothetical protein